MLGCGATSWGGASISAIVFVCGGERGNVDAVNDAVDDVGLRHLMTFIVAFNWFNERSKNVAGGEIEGRSQRSAEKW